MKPEVKNNRSARLSTEQSTSANLEGKVLFPQKVAKANLSAKTTNLLELMGLTKAKSNRK